MNFDSTALFVYYKVALTERQACRHQLVQFIAALKHACPDLQMDILQRPDPSVEGMETWMEVYACVGGVTEAHRRSIASLAAEMGMPAKRAVEQFIPLRP
jgi:hypothetical protein